MAIGEYLESIHIIKLWDFLVNQQQQQESE